MSQAENNMKVVNEEYDRVLENPDNVIMSDALAEILGDNWSDLVTDKADTAVSTISTEKNTINIMDGDEVTATIHGQLQSFGSAGGSLYSLGFTLRGSHKEFLNTLMSTQTEGSSVGLQVLGQNGFIAEGLHIDGWSFSNLDPYDILLSINFGSSDVTFR